jgi:EpsD family peptidyl-prolyl cis-trans isomerase
MSPATAAAGSSTLGSSLSDRPPALQQEPLRPLLWALVFSALATGCREEGAVPESQVAARVNGEDISVHQVQAVLARQPRLVAAVGDASTQRVLEALIDQELASQAARDQGLASDPLVIQSKHASERELLARAHHDRIAAKAGGSTSDEIDRYYDSRPGLFAQRRLYVLQETAIEAADTQIEEAKAIALRSRSADELVRALKEAGFRPASRQFVQAAEDLPMVLLEPLASAEPGQSRLFAQAGGARIFTIIYAHAAPVDRRTAAPAITEFLLAERKRQLVADEMKRLRQAAQVSYGGAFARGAASAPLAAASAPAPR